MSIQTTKVLLITSLSLLLTSCQSVPNTCISLITSLQKKSYEKASEDDYYISKVSLFSNSTCYNYSGNKLSYNDWIPCDYSIEINPDGSLKSRLGVIWCNQRVGCNGEGFTHNAFELNKKWKLFYAKTPNISGFSNANELTLSEKKNIGPLPYFQFENGAKFDFVHNVKNQNRINSVALIPYYLANEGLILKNNNTLQCKAVAETSKGQSDTFFFSIDNWGKWSITPEHSGTVQFEIQSY